ncbi:hypothetical protein [Pseudoclavibacter sp. AY1H1]|nr:hypothetical protein [Pseudoclavibacter sp. AY1H1]
MNQAPGATPPTLQGAAMEVITLIIGIAALIVAVIALATAVRNRR